MRILVVNLLFPPVISGGYEIECQQVADGLSARGHELAVLACDHRRAGTVETSSYPVWRQLALSWPLEERPAHGMRWRRTWTCHRNRALTRRVIASFRPDLVYLWSQLRIGMGAARAAADLGVRYAWRIGDEFLAAYLPARFEPTSHGIAAWAWDRWISPESTCAGLDFRSVSSITRALADSLIAKGLPLERAVVIPKGIPMELFPRHVDPGPHREVRLLYTGRLHPEKGVHTLIDAAHRLAARLSGRPVHLTLVGAGAPDYVAQLVGRVGPARVTFAGQQDYRRLPAEYGRHDIFVFPSIIGEGLGATQQEAMASALPIVSTAHGGQGEFLRDGENGLAFPAGDVDALTDRLARLVADPALCAKLAAGGRATAERHFSMDRYVDRTVEFLEGALCRA